MTAKEAIYFLNMGLTLKVYEGTLIVCKSSPTGLKVVLPDNSSYYPNYSDIKRAEIL